MNHVVCRVYALLQFGECVQTIPSAGAKVLTQSKVDVCFFTIKVAHHISGKSPGMLWQTH